MSIPKDKRNWLEGILSPERLEELDKELEGKAALAAELELESKAKDAPADEGTEPEAVEPEAPEEPAESEAGEEESVAVTEPEAVTQDDLKQIADAMGDALAVMSKAIQEMAEDIKGLKQADEDKIAEVVKDTPAASLAAMIRGRAIGSVTGREETRVDGRSTLAKSGPKENKDQGSGATGIPLIDAFLHGGDGDWRAALGEDLVPQD